MTWREGDRLAMFNRMRLGKLRIKSTCSHQPDQGERFQFLTVKELQQKTVCGGMQGVHVSVLGVADGPHIGAAALKTSDPKSTKSMLGAVGACCSTDEEKQCQLSKGITLYPWLVTRACMLLH